jgi:hypothetical protein
MRRAIVSLVLIVVSVFATARAAEATPLLGIHWAGDGVRVVTVYDRSHPRRLGMSRTEWRRLLHEVFAEWEASGVVDFRRSRERVGCNALVHGIVMCDDRGDFSWAVSYFTATDVDLATGTIHSGIIRWSTALPFYGSSLRAIMCHELGHSIGLDHAPDGSLSCMAGDSPYPSDDDIATIQSLYSTSG